MEISETIHLLGDLLGQVLTEQESPALFEAVERVRALAKTRRSEADGDEAEAALALTGEVARMDQYTARVIASAFALYFDLVNTAEDNDRINALRQEALQKAPGPVHDSIEEAIQLLKASGLTPEDLSKLLDHLDIELVLTAHPTEARRRTILSKVVRIGEALRVMSHTQLLPREQQAQREALHNEIATLWLTDRARTAQPTPTDEVRTALYFVGQVFWNVLPEIYELMEAALVRYYPGVEVRRPWLRLASWMGGDRDGNPNVTHDVTAETLTLHRGLAVENHRRSLQDLSRRLSLSDEEVPLPPTLREWLARRPPLPPHAAQIRLRYPREPYRLILSLLAHDLAEASQDDMKARLLSRAPHSARIRVEDLAGPLDAIAETVPPPVAAGQLEITRRQIEIFDLHGARVDIREDAGRLNAALGEVLRGLGIEPNFEELDTAARRALLVRLLEEPAPPLAAQPGVTPETAETWQLFQLITRARDVYGPGLLGPLVISMASSVADVLAVQLVTCWSGCADGMQIVPLFETIQDLQNAPQVMDELLSEPVYRKHLDTCPTGQMVMIGYSDSNKDGGFLMANWALYQAQREVTNVCRRHNVPLTLFHGRGGTAARGGGPVNRAILAAPGGTVDGRYRLTEQGEIITSRYWSTDLALRNIEQIVHAVLLASAPVCLAPDPHLQAEPGGAGCAQRVSPETLPEEWQQAMDRMSAAAFRQYRQLVFETPGFMDYWQAATPIEEIKRMRIGSRPAARKPGAEHVSKIRAIPWVFSWMQSRFNLPGWYGLGSGLAVLGEQPGQGDAPSGLQLLREMYQGWPFFRLLLESAEMSLSKADMPIAAMYNELVPDRALAGRIFDEIQAEYNRAVAMVLQITGQPGLMSAEPVIQRSIRLRNPYVDPLNYIQVEMLRRLRAMPDPEAQDAQDLREVVMMTITGISAGLRNTG